MRNVKWVCLCTALSVPGCAQEHESVAKLGESSSTKLDAGDPVTHDGGGFYVPDATSEGHVEDAQIPVAPSDAGLIPATPDPSWSRFDPNEVYIYGTLEEGACYRDAVAHWSTPNLALTGFACGSGDARVRSSDGRMIYYDAHTQSERAFFVDARVDRADESYPDSPSDNDDALLSPACVGQGTFVFGPDADTYIYSCRAGGAWYGPSGETAYEGAEDVRVYGAQHTLLLETSIYRIEASDAVRIEGLPAYGDSPIAVRSVDDGFWLALQEPNSTEATLWHVALDGTARQVGSYSAFSMDLWPQSGTCALDGSGALFQIAGRVSSPEYDVILRRTIDGTTDVVYDEASMPLVRVHISFLVTGARQTHL